MNCQMKRAGTTSVLVVLAVFAGNCGTETGTDAARASLTIASVAVDRDS